MVPAVWSRYGDNARRGGPVVPKLGSVSAAVRRLAAVLRPPLIAAITATLAVSVTGCGADPTVTRATAARYRTEVLTGVRELYLAIARAGAATGRGIVAGYYLCPNSSGSSVFYQASTALYPGRPSMAPAVLGAGLAAVTREAGWRVKPAAAGSPLGANGTRYAVSRRPAHGYLYAFRDSSPRTQGSVVISSPCFDAGQLARGLEHHAATMPLPAVPAASGTPSPA
jgi:hypothetical protein